VLDGDGQRVRGGLVGGERQQRRSAAGQDGGERTRLEQLLLAGAQLRS
jgi:hypothetical protein